MPQHQDMWIYIVFPEYTSDFTLIISFDPYNDPARQTIMIVSILYKEDTES